MADSFHANLQTAACLFYDELPPEVQRSFMEGLKSVDADGNGYVSQAELINSCREPNGPLSGMVSRLPKVFSVLDTDGNGYLDLMECKCLFFLLSASTACSNCGDVILDFGFICLDCCNDRGPTYDLCLKCYPNKVNCHRHGNFTPQMLIYANLPNTRVKQVQCVVCGDFHRKDIPGVLIETHMVIDPESDNHVCEWCVTWYCSGCGKHFQGSSSNATPGRWMLTSYYCKPCGATGDRTSIAPTIKTINESKVVESCNTCKIKANNETLWSGSRSASNGVCDT